MIEKSSGRLSIRRVRVGKGVAGRERDDDGDANGAEFLVGGGGDGDDDEIGVEVEVGGVECEMFCVRGGGRGGYEETDEEGSCDGGVLLGKGATEGLRRVEVVSVVSDVGVEVEVELGLAVWAGVEGEEFEI